MAVLTLPSYPSTKARSSLSPSQLATLNSKISSTLAQVIAFPGDKKDVSNIEAFISSYAKDHAHAVLEALIWDPEHASKSGFSKMSQVEKAIHQHVLKLAEKIAVDLNLQTIIDICVVYGRTSPKRTRELLTSIANGSSTLSRLLDSDAVPAFTSLLPSSSQGLYGLRKIAYVLYSFLKPAPPEIIRPFARSKHFVLALASAYDASLLSLSRSYGGLQPSRISNSNTSLDDWERIFLETKVELIDVIHVMLRTLLDDVEAVSLAGPALAARCEVAFEIVFALLELQPTRSATDDTIPFMNCTILEDYQHSYDLSKLLSRATRRADDPRTELLESALSALDTQGPQSNPGALRLLIRSSGMPPGIDNLGKGPSRADSKGKGRALPPPPADPALDAAVAQVLEIFPEQDSEYLRYVLQHPDFPFKGDGERLIGALLEGTAPEVDSSQYAGGVTLPSGQTQEKLEDRMPHTIERRNVFDDEKLDLSKLRIGKKQDDTNAVLQDRAFVEQMKADILRWAEAMSDDEEEDDSTEAGVISKGVDVAFEDELDDGGAVKVRDGQSEDEGDPEADGGEDKKLPLPAKPETTLELAYIRDPKLFERDAQTRRSKARQDLKAQTGWSDEQIEGWRIMLERNPHKDKILQKHEFSGNQRGPIVMDTPGPSAHRGRGGARGGGGQRGRGGGRGGRGDGQGHNQDGGDGGQSRGDGGSARDKAWKDKNKASRGNHNRKRGHDKKMARAGGPS